MFVQYYVDMIVFEVFYQFLRFGNQFTVPAIACPTSCAGMSGSDFGILCMPSLNEHPHDGIRPHEDSYQAFVRDLGVDTQQTDVPLFDAGKPVTI